LIGLVSDPSLGPTRTLTVRRGTMTADITVPAGRLGVTIEFVRQ
jgi:hypothetical protein